MARKKPQDDRISRLYTKHCHGIPIPIMETITVMKVAREALAADPAISDDDLGGKMRAYVENIAVKV